MRRALWIVALASGLALAGCKKKEAPPAAAPPATQVQAAPVAAAADHPAIAQSCQSCHGADMLAQQRLTAQQWEEVVNKMRGWGAVITDEQAKSLADFLAQHYTPESGPFIAPPISASAAARQLAPAPDGPFAGGNASDGKALFEARCAVCHGADARGLIGVNLTDRPILFQAPHFAATVRAGRGQMPPAADLEDQQIANILSYLRSLPGVQLSDDPGAQM